LHRKGLAFALSLLVTLAMASTASAAPVEGPSGEAFYTPPETLPEGGAGTLIWYRPTTLNLGVELPGYKAYDVLYKSTNQTNEGDVVTGTVIVPTAAWTGSGARPIVDYAIGTQGLGHQCAPSLQMAAGTEYDGGAVIASMKKGYAVVVTDYQGYTNGAVPSYTAGKAEGRAVLDIARAAGQLPGGVVSSSAPLVVWGYSQGGQAVGWAGQLVHTYAPELDTVGVAAGGTPGNLLALTEFGEGSVANAFGIDGNIGLAYAYQSIANPEAFLAEEFNAEGLAVVAKLKNECALQSLSEFRDVAFSSLTKNHETEAELIKHNSLTEQIINQQKLGGTAIPVPVYHYHGLEDEFVPVKQDAELHQAWCSLGVKDDFQLFPGEHLLTDPTAIPYVTKWIEERLAGKEAPSTCGLHSPSEPLPPNARLMAETGDLIVPLPNWQVTGSVTDAKLGVTLKVPAGATFNAEGDVTAGTVTASLKVPPIEETIRLFGLLPVTIRGSLEQAGPITGTVGLSNTGVLSLNATGGANLTAKSLGISFFNINLGCKTVTPIQLPLNISEPVNALAVGNISIKDTVTIPPFGGCGPINGPLVTALLSGEGNTVTLSSAPPPPIPF
jgi:hypothetical protein